MLLVGAQLSVRTVSTFRTFSDQSNAAYPTAASSSSSMSVQFSIRLHLTAKQCRSAKPILISCHSASGTFGPRSSDADNQDNQFLEASLLVSETVLHYRMLRQGIQEDIKWNPSYSKTKLPTSRSKITSIGQAFLSRFSSPTIFLKIACDGDFLLPIIVGEFAIEKLIAAFLGDEDGGNPDQFQLVNNLVERLGYEVKMVKITEKVVHRYFAKLYLTKQGENDVLSVDARPSDAINVATRCKAPIYVNKQIVLSDAIKMGNGMGRVRDMKPTYDVYLDSASDGPDLLTEELHLMMKMNLAVKEERYSDAAMLRDKLMKLRNSTPGP